MKSKYKPDLKILDHPDRKINYRIKKIKFVDGEVTIKYYEGNVTLSTALWFLEQAKLRVLS